MLIYCIKTVYIRDDCRQPPITDRIGFIKGNTYKPYLREYRERETLFCISEEGKETLIANSFEGWRKDEWFNEHFILKEGYNCSN